MKLANLNISGIDILVLIFAIPMLYPVLRRFMRIVFNQTKITRKILSVFDNIFSEKNLHKVSATLFLIFFFTLFILQKNLSIHFIEPTSSEFNLVEIYGFVIGILSMYGIYIGFLQFIIGDSEKARYLGKNKLKYLTDKSIWYQITQTKTFLITLFLLTIFPILIINTQDDIQNDLIYIWQSGLILVLCIYIFLIGMSLEILWIMFLIKDEIDSGLESNVKKSIQNEYYKQFAKMYKTGFQDEEIKWFFKLIEYDLQKVDKIEVDEFFITIFSRIERNISSSFGSFKKVRNVKLYYGKNERFLYNDYKRFINKKWSFLTSIQEDIDFFSFKELIQDDSDIFTLLINENPELIEKKERLPIHKQINVHKYLFDKLLEKALLDNEVNGLCKDVKDTTREIKDIDSKKEVLINYYTDVEKYKWEKIFDEYLKIDISFELPKFKQKETRTVPSFDNEGQFETCISDYDNYEFYSDTLFRYLSRNFHYLTEEQIENECLITLLQTMDEEYRVAYAIYQFLYPDKGSFGKNTSFFEEQLREAFYYMYDEKEKEDLFLKSAQKVANLQDVGHKLTLTVLKEIFYNRNKSIENVTYFEEFYYSRISIVKWLYFQNLLTSDNQYTPRISITDKQDSEEIRIVEGICTRYLRDVDEFPKLYNDFGLMTTIKKLLEVKPLDSKIILHDMGVVGLMCYESLIANVCNRKNVFVNTIKYNYAEEESYYFMSLGIFEFFVWKLIDVDYEDIFQNEVLLNAMKDEGNSVLRKNNMTINEFVESIYNKLRESTIGNVGKIDIELVANKLTKILL